MGGATAARTVEYHRLARGVKAFASSAQADGLLPRATAHPVRIELADFPRLTRLSSHAEADGSLSRVTVGDPRVGTVPRDLEALQHRHDAHRQDDRARLGSGALHAPPEPRRARSSCRWESWRC